MKLVTEFGNVRFNACSMVSMQQFSDSETVNPEINSLKANFCIKVTSPGGDSVPNKFFSMQF
jgi:hypothetical protein